MNDKFGTAYLRERGLSDEAISANHIEITPSDAALIKERLGEKCLPIFSRFKFVEIIWFPVFGSNNGDRISWWARMLPTAPKELKLPKFLTPTGGTGVPYITKHTRSASRGSPLLITEGPAKALVLDQAGYCAAGLCGVWGAATEMTESFEGAGEKLLRPELTELEMMGRKIYLAFDADSELNPKVRQAEIRCFFLLTQAGAEVYQLRNWKVEQGKGIDDHLMMEKRDGRAPSDVVRDLLAKARPFKETFSPTSLDVKLVGSELGKVFLSPLIRNQLCGELYKPLGITAEALRSIGPQKDNGTEGISKFMVDPEPWPEPVSATALFTEISTLIKKHMAMSDENILAATLWIILTWCVEAVDVLPLLAITSPDKRCGKTRLLTLIGGLVRRPLSTSTISASALYRCSEKWRPTMLVDEFDSSGTGNEDLRNVLNSGHTRNSPAIRCNPITLEPEAFDTFCPKAIGGIGTLPETLRDRSIEIRMERRAKSQKIEPLRNTKPEQHADLCRKLMRWSADHLDEIRAAIPGIPETLNDREADNWQPLFVIAKVAAGDWLKKLREAIAAFEPDEDDVDIIEELNADKEAPWADWRYGKDGIGISPHKLGRYLSSYKIKSVQEGRVRGYLLEKLKPVFERYL